jgi:hypothetical protein
LLASSPTFDQFSAANYKQMSYLMDKIEQIQENHMNKAEEAEGIYDPHGLTHSEIIPPSILCSLLLPYQVLP